MLVVPVVDLRRGQVVHAVRGERAAYRPVRSTLAGGCEPAVIARALLDASGSDTLYIADLDALLGEAPQVASLRALHAALPGAALWLDAGFGDAASARSLLDAIGRVGTTTPVFASESLRSSRELLGMDDDGAILSLDQRGGSALDRAGLWGDPSSWPSRVIAMSLDRVGSGDGPDLALLAQLRERAAPRGVKLIGAGGIRDRDNLAACEAAGAHAWLVASALHDGRLRAAPAGTGLATCRVA